MYEIAQRRTYLLQCSQEVVIEHGVWSEEIELAVLPEGRFDRALQSLFEAFEYGDMPEDLRGVDHVVHEFRQKYEAYQLAMEQSNNSDQSPPAALADFVRQLDALFITHQMKEKPPLETIADLDRQRVSDRQIAVIYEWQRPDGSPDIDRVRAQRRNDPNKEFPHPENARIRQRQEQEKHRMEDALRKQAEREADANREPPESIEQLIEQGVSGKQIGEIHGISLSQLERYCHDNDLPMPIAKHSVEQAAVDAKDADDARNNPPPLSEEDVDDDLMSGGVDSSLSLEAQIIATAESDPGLKHGEIADLLDTSRQKVSATLARREEVVS